MTIRYPVYKVRKVRSRWYVEDWNAFSDSPIPAVELIATYPTEEEARAHMARLTGAAPIDPSAEMGR